MKMNRLLIHCCTALCVLGIVGCHNANNSKSVDIDGFENEKPLPKNLKDEDEVRPEGATVFSQYVDFDNALFYQYEVLDEEAKTAALVDFYPATADGQLTTDNSGQCPDEYTIPSEPNGYSIIQLGVLAKPGVSGRNNPSGFTIAKAVKKLIIPSSEAWRRCLFLYP